MNNPPAFLRRSILGLAVFAAVAAVSSRADAQVLYSSGTYSQNFNTDTGGLPSTGGPFTYIGAGPFNLTSAPLSASGLTGWQITRLAGSGTTTNVRVSNGASSTSGIYSFGPSVTGTEDRALGVINGSAEADGFGLVLQNTSGVVMDSFTLSYTGEQWRLGRASGATDTLNFGYKTGTSADISGPFTSVSQLSFSSPITSGTVGALNGNLGANQTAISFTVTGITWNPGEYLVLDWASNAPNTGSNGLAIDNVVFTAVPEPSIVCLLGSVGLLGVLRRRRSLR